MIFDDLSVGDFICSDCNRRWDTHSRCVIKIGEEVRPVCRECYAVASGQALVDPNSGWPKSQILYDVVRSLLFASTVVTCLMVGIVAIPMLLMLFGLNAVAGRARF